MFGWSCNNHNHIKRIRLSIAALVLLFGLGFGVIAATYTVFDSRLKVDDIPQSMLERKTPPLKNTLPLFLFVIAGFGLPLGAYIAATLAECEKKAAEERSQMSL